MKRLKDFPAARGYDDWAIRMQARRANGIGALLGVALALVLMFAPAAYDYWQDDRPAEGSATCDEAKEAIAKDPALFTAPPAEFLERINHACK